MPLAEIFRADLIAAGVTRDALHQSTLTDVMSNFRSCRDSGITWLAMTGLGLEKISRREGHDTIQTTRGYVKQAEDLTGDLGEPFAALPMSLVGESPSSIAPVAAFEHERAVARDRPESVDHVTAARGVHAAVPGSHDDEQPIASSTAQLVDPKAKLVKRRAYGYKSFTNYRLRLLNACA